jgi:hypothetical protein
LTDLLGVRPKISLTVSWRKISSKLSLIFKLGTLDKYYWNYNDNPQFWNLFEGKIISDSFNKITLKCNVGFYLSSQTDGSKW